ncbi:hypothetical protein BV898_19142 [Hypsibius exemplaris]|uniref:Uncharacterized protein n=1 Tax=Hypsibius exemplaris TaxID=2072580 RepID=A0A9X6NL36_HYPEX|nr:hypothetical protein BV898_19142 [Hypsibius exemplaris]
MKQYLCFTKNLRQATRILPAPKFTRERTTWKFLPQLMVLTYTRTHVKVVALSTVVTFTGHWDDGTTASVSYSVLLAISAVRIPPDLVKVPETLAE